MPNHFLISCFVFSGGKKILLFCEKVDKNDVEVHFTLYTKSKHNCLEIHLRISIHINSYLIKNENTYSYPQIILKVENQLRVKASLLPVEYTNSLAYRSKLRNIPTNRSEKMLG